MGLLTDFKLLGLDSRSNDLDQTPNASDLLNVCFTKKRSITKRDGHTKQNTGVGAGANFGENGLFTNARSNEILAIETVLKKYATGTWTEVNGTLAAPWTDGKVIDSVEINGVLYFTNEDNNVYKYDGLTFYKAGLPRPSSLTTAIGGVGTAQTGTFRYYCEYFYVDHRENVIFSDYATTTQTLTAQAVLISPANLLTAEGFHNHYFKVNGTQNYTVGVAPYTIVLNVAAGFTVKVGDRVPIFFDSYTIQDEYGDYLFAEVTAINTVGNTVTLLMPDDYLSGPIYQFLANSVYSLIVKRIYKEDSNGTWFIKDLINDPTNTSTTIINTAYPETVPGGGYAIAYAPPTELRSYFTFEIPNALFDPLKYISICYFQNQLFLADSDTIYWSQVDEPETLSAFNTQVFNDDSEGNITAIRNINDYLVIFKEKAIYFGSGNFGVNQNLRFWRINTDDIGSVNIQSIQIIKGEMIFLNSYGIWSVIAGREPQELGAKINNLITENTVGFNLANAVSVHDIKNNRYMLYIPATLAANSRVFVFDYYHGEWFIYSAMDMSDGALYFGDNIYFLDTSSALQKMIPNQRNDNTSAISAYYRTHWIDAGSSGIEKKYLNLDVYAVETANYTLAVKTEKDYIEGTYYTDDNIEVDTTSGKRHSLNLHDNNALATRLSFENATVDEDLLFTGYQIEIEGAAVKRRKDDF